MSVDVSITPGGRSRTVVDLDAVTITPTPASLLVRTVLVVADDSAVRHGCGAVLPSYFAGLRPRCPRCGQTA